MEHGKPKLKMENLKKQEIADRLKNEVEAFCKPFYFVFPNSFYIDIFYNCIANFLSIFVNFQCVCSFCQSV